MSDFFVDATLGNDAGAGTQLDPWQSIDPKVNGESYSGDDFIFAKRGEIWRETLTVPSSGSDGNPITFGTYGTGATPIINGADLVSTWTQSVSAGANYGDETGPAGADEYQDDFLYFRGVSVTAPGTLTSIRMYVQDGNGTVAKMALYDDDGGVPGALVVGSDSAEVTLTDGVSQEFTFTPSGSPSLSVGTYYIVYWGESFNITASRAQAGAGVLDGFQALTYDGNFPATADIDSFGTKDGITNQYIVLAGVPIENVWQAALTTEPNNVFFDGTKGALESGGVGSLNTDQEWFWDSNVLYQYSTSDPDTRYTAPGTEAAQRASACVVDGIDYITIDGLQFEKTNNGDTNVGGGIHLDDTTHVILQNNTVLHAGTNGIFLLASAGVSSDNIVTGNTVKWSHNFDGWGSLIRLLGSDSNTLTDNVLEDAGSTTNSGKFIVTNSDGNVIRGNRVTGRSADGITLDGSVGNTIEKNYVADCTDVGLEVKAGADDNTFSYNLCINNGVAFQGDGNSGVNDGNFVYNNTIYWEDGTSTGYGISLIVNNTNYTIKNNIVFLNHDADATALTATGTITGLVLDNNIYRNGCVHAVINYGGDFYACSAFATYQSEKSQDANSLTLDPLMADPGNGDFTLQAASPAIDAGADVSLTQDFAGTTVPQGAAPDMGAFERIGMIGPQMMMGVGT